MISTLLSFLGGSVFRMLWGEIASFITAKQEHAHEIERMKAQGELDAAQHARTLEAIKQQAELGVQTIRVQAEADTSRTDAEAFSAASASLFKATGIWFVDAWNGVIRPATATVCLGLWVRHVAHAGWVLDDQGWSILSAALGLYLADRALAKRGK